ncbi:MAG: amidohydrolase family protein [Ktedonobacterales bacterium]
MSAAGTCVGLFGALAHRPLDAKVQRAIRLGIRVTVQHPLLYSQGAAILRLWGPERAQAALPVRAWLDEGAQVSAGSDYPAASYDTMRSIWGLVTRGTQGAGTLGHEYAVDRYTALWLYTIAGARLSGESERRGTLQPHRLADLVAFPADPISCPVDEPLAIRPVFTMVGGRAMYDPDGRLGTRVG